MHVSDAYVCGISRQNSFKGGECETPENLNFQKKGKMVILVENWKFSRSRMTKQTLQLDSSHEI